MTITHHAGGTTLTDTAIPLMRALTLRSGIRLYQNTGMRMTRSVGPAQMMKYASDITGKKLKSRDYAGAITALDHWITEARVRELQVHK
jgi:hypothetical protein